MGDPFGTSPVPQHSSRQGKNHMPRGSDKYHNRSLEPFKARNCMQRGVTYQYRNVYGSRCDAASRMCSAMASEDVAAGDGAFRTCNVRCERRM